MVRATFTIGKQWTLADEQLPPVEADEYWDKPGESSIKYACSAFKDGATFSLSELFLNLL